MSYREKIYKDYGKNFQDAKPKFNTTESRKWGKARNWHLRKWMPAQVDAKIVDLACGGGKLLHFFVEKGYTQVAGVDLSEDQVELSRQVTNDVTQGDVINYLKMHPNHFDLITGFDIVEHFQKDEVMEFIEAVYGALQSGGRVILQTPNAESPWGTHHRYNDFTHEVCFNPNSIGRLLKLFSFGQVEFRECDPVPIGYSFNSTIRSILWRGLVKPIINFYNLVETGETGQKVNTRIFLVSAVK